MPAWRSAWGKVARTEDELVELVEKVRFRFRVGSKVWSVAHHTALYGAAVLSALAAVALKLPDEPATDTAAVLATVAALLTTLSSLGGFRTRWRANRDAFYAMDCLILDIGGGGLTTAEIRERLKKIRTAQHEAWGREPAAE